MSQIFRHFLASFLCTCLLIGATSAQEARRYFFQPSETKNLQSANEIEISLIGYVKVQSLEINDLSVSFELVDKYSSILVIYNGILPDLFFEGEPAAVQGTLTSKGFIAHSILVSFTADYLPEGAINELRELGFVE